MKNFALIMIAAGAISSCANIPEQTADYNVVPLPQQIDLTPDGGSFRLSKSTLIAYPAGNDTLRRDAEHLQGYIQALTGQPLKIVDDTPSNDAIVLHSDLSFPTAKDM